MPEDLPDVEEPEVEPEEAEVEETTDESEESEVGEQQEEELQDEEVEEEEPEEEEEEEEELQPSKYHRPVFSELKKEYPDLFKKFPDLREVYFREAKFSTLYPTVEDAEEAFNKASNFDTLSQSLLSGSPKLLLDELEKSGKDKVASVAEKFLPAVLEKSQDLYYSIVSPIVEGFVLNLYKEGERTNNENMKNAALYAMQYGWNHMDPEMLGKPKKATSPEIEEEKKRLADERNKIHTEHYREAYTAVDSRAKKLLVTEISKAVSSIPDEFSRSAAIREIFEKTNEVLSADERHMRLMNSLWQKAQKSGFSPESRSRLVTTLLVRAKQILPAVSREIMAQINPKKEVKKVVKKSDAGGKIQPKEKEAESSMFTQPKGKVDWSKYKSGKNFLDAFVDGKGKVART